MTFFTSVIGVNSESDYRAHQEVCRTYQSEDGVRTIYNWSGMPVLLTIFILQH
jgi:hypothetical protein